MIDTFPALPSCIFRNGSQLLILLVQMVVSTYIYPVNGTGFRYEKASLSDRDTDPSSLTFRGPLVRGHRSMWIRIFDNEDGTHMPHVWETFGYCTSLRERVSYFCELFALVPLLPMNTVSHGVPSQRVRSVLFVSLRDLLALSSSPNGHDAVAWCNSGFCTDMPSLLVDNGLFGIFSSNSWIVLRDKLRVGMHGALDLDLLLPNTFRRETCPSSMSVCAVLDLCHNLRQCIQSLAELEATRVEDEGLFLRTENCLKNRGMDGRQPTMIPIDISAKLIRMSSR